MAANSALSSLVFQLNLYAQGFRADNHPPTLADLIRSARY